MALFRSRVPLTGLHSVPRESGQKSERPFSLDDEGLVADKCRNRQVLVDNVLARVSFSACSSTSERFVVPVNLARFAGYAVCLSSAIIPENDNLKVEHLRIQVIRKKHRNPLRQWAELYNWCERKFWEKQSSQSKGPNGCGKSNVIDAICFAFTEDIADLRVSKLSDLVTNHSIAGGYAEVVMTVINEADERKYELQARIWGYEHDLVRRTNFGIFREKTPIIQYKINGKLKQKQGTTDRRFCGC